MELLSDRTNWATGPERLLAFFCARSTKNLRYRSSPRVEGR